VESYLEYIYFSNAFFAMMHMSMSMKSVYCKMVTAELITVINDVFLKTFEIKIADIDMNNIFLHAHIFCTITHF
jgi:hypothetical protein